jgi:hypothetical protein
LLFYFLFININHSVKPASEMSLGMEAVFRDEDVGVDQTEISNVKFEDCLQEEEPSLNLEEMYFDAPYNSLGNKNNEPVYEDDNRKRVVRFFEDEEEDPNEESMGGGFMMMGGVATAGMLASKASEAFHDSDASICTLDVFDEGGPEGNSNNNTSQNLQAMMDADEDDDSSDNSFDEEEEQEKQIRKTLLMTIVGIGFMGLVGYGMKKLKTLLSRGNDQDLGAGDIAGDVIDTPTHVSSSQATTQASFNATANESSRDAFAGAWMGNNPAAMTGTQ